MKKEIMKKIAVLFILLSGVLLTGQSLFGLGLEVPELKYWVNDQAGILNKSQESTLENLLTQTSDKTSSQVVLLVIQSLRGEVLEDFSLRVAEKNKIGRKEFDNGVLVLVAMAERKIRIEVGYGLEPIITDIKSGYIIRELMVPHFKKGDYYAGINRGLSAVTGLITKDFEITPEQLAKYRKKRTGRKGGHTPFAFIVFVIIVILMFFKGGTRGGRRSGGIFYGGGFGGGGGGGVGGGGFSGGGGSFGGGGSSGGW